MHLQQFCINYVRLTNWDNTKQPIREVGVNGGLIYPRSPTVQGQVQQMEPFARKLWPVYNERRNNLNHNQLSEGANHKWLLSGFIANSAKSGQIWKMHDKNSSPVEATHI